MRVRSPPGVLMKTSNKEWKCQFCDLIFQRRKDLFEHLSNSHSRKIRKRHQICKFCGQVMENIRKHNRICEKRSHGPHRWTEEEKKRHSEKRKLYLKQNPDKHPWKLRVKFRSAPCEKLKSRLLADGFEFIEEYTDMSWDHSYSIDIAILSKKIGIEVNGNQHYLRTGELKPVYQKRHDYLINQGWNLIELHYANCYHEDKIKELEDAIISGKSIDESEHLRLFANRRVKQEKIKKGQYKLPYSVWEERKKIILSSNADMSKIGWQRKVSKATGLTRVNIRDTIKHFREEFEKIAFIRK